MAASSRKQIWGLVLILTIFTVQIIFVSCKQISKSEIKDYRQRVSNMFYHAYNSYLQYAYPYDELRPLSCDGIDTWGSFSLTLIDALDTLVVLGNYSEFRRVAQLLIDEIHFDTNINVSVFETNIRVIGGLLSAHLMFHKAGMELEPGWPCSGPLLRLAETVARKILPAFETETGMPFGTVNLLHGVPKGETSITCTAGVTTFIVEFGTLSRLTGDPVFENVALRALMSMWKSRSPIGLVGNHIDVQTGAWSAVDSGIGAGVDSYYEYLVKGSILLQRPELMEMFKEYRQAIDRYMLRDDWYMWVNMQKGQVTMPLFQSLEAYWPGLLSLVGDIESALKSLYNYHQIWKQYGFMPEFYNIPASEVNVNREGYPLRPEFIESIMYLYRATKDPTLLQMGVDILESIQHSARTPCGYAMIKDVRDHKMEDRMESFFLAETTKYLYLLFDDDNFLHENGGHGTVIDTANGKCIINAGNYVFNTEAHPIDVSAVYCCSAKKKDDLLLKQFENSLDFLSLFGIKNTNPLQLFSKMRKHLQKKWEEDSDDLINYSERKSASNGITKPKNETEINSHGMNKSVSYNKEEAEKNIKKLAKSPLNIPNKVLTNAQTLGVCKKEDFRTLIKNYCPIEKNKKNKIDIKYFPDDFAFINDALGAAKLLSENVGLNFQSVVKNSFTSEKAVADTFGSSSKNIYLQETKGCSKHKTALSSFQQLFQTPSLQNTNNDVVKTRKLVSSMDRDNEGEIVRNRMTVKTYKDVESNTEKTTKDFETIKSEINNIVVEVEKQLRKKYQTNLEKRTKSNKDSLEDDSTRVSPPVDRISNYSAKIDVGQEKVVPSDPINSKKTARQSSSNRSKIRDSHNKCRHKIHCDYTVLKCLAQPFFLRLSLMGEMFEMK